jgi:hypothetical protein
MTEYARVATFEADSAAIDAMVSQINAEDGAPEGVPATRVTVLADRAAGKLVVAVRFGSEEDLRTGAEKLDSMSPPPEIGTLRRVSVDVYEVVLERATS